ncbi:hypothetical protein C1645_818127 [Glomus cerebriforme]|uniref:Uncharacterized protein n=1 Tax=Glomus cerebriforme TaxID=658196 RepID=A0A397T8W3_9GLOM|nr:hypothetical protein C1645_818127 [Glomus cerebriforme]
MAGLELPNKRLCKPISDLQDKIDKTYGIVPYMIPEVLRNKPYTPANLMKKYWGSGSFKRPAIIKLENIISQWLRCVNEYYEYISCNIDS